MQESTETEENFGDLTEDEIKEEKKKENTQSSLSAKQIEEIWIKSELGDRQEVWEWCKSQKNKSDIIKIPEGKEGQPEYWQIKTIDTQRYNNFKFKQLYCRMVPQCPSEKVLFDISMFFFKKVAVSLSLLLSRYEKVNSGYIVAVNVPMDCLKIFIESQNVQNTLEIENNDDIDFREKPQVLDSNYKENSLDKKLHQKTKTVKKYWASRGVENVDDMFRGFSYSLFTMRGDINIPAIILCSIVDHQIAVVTFRDHSTFTEADTTQFYSSILHFRDIPFLSWPLYDFPVSLDKPRIYCENPNCTNYSGLANDQDLMELYKNHNGPLEKEIESNTKMEGYKQWKDTYEDKALKEIDELDMTNLSSNEQSDKRNTIYEKWTKIMEDQIIEKVHQDSCSPLKKCTRCKIVSYCSRNCQSKDWQRHKSVCVKQN